MRDTCRIVCSLLLVIVFAAPSVSAGLPEFSVDCDKGESLQRVLNELERVGGGRVLVSGTCYGARVVSPSVIQIIGESPQTTSLNSGPGAAVYAYGEGWLEVANVRLAGGDGLLATGPNRSVVVSNCEIEAGWSGIRADQGAGVSVVDSTVSGQMNAIVAWYSSVFVEGSRLHDSTFAARLFDARLVLNGVEVLDNEIGVFAEDRSQVSVAEGRFARNGQGHLGAIRDSRLSIYNAEVGAHGDPTNLSIYADRGSSVEVYYDDLQSEIWGPATIFNDSYISIEGAMLHGSIALRSFSRLLLDGRVLDGIVDCQSAADAVCGHTASAFTRGCGSIPEDECVPGQPAASGEIVLPFVPELLKLPPPARPMSEDLTLDSSPAKIQTRGRTRPGSRGPVDAP